MIFLKEEFEFYKNSLENFLIKKISKKSSFLLLLKFNNFLRV